MFKPTKMPVLKLHCASGRAYVYHQGRREYFGKHGTSAANEAYRRWVATLLLGEKKLAADLAQHDLSRLTLPELSAAYLEWANGYYEKNGLPTTPVGKILRHLKAMLKCHRSTLVDDCGPNTLRTTQKRLIAEGYTRQGVNELVKGIRAVFK
jgi:hypothetical protein